MQTEHFYYTNSEFLFLIFHKYGIIFFKQINLREVNDSSWTQLEIILQNIISDSPLPPTHELHYDVLREKIDLWSQDGAFFAKIVNGSKLNIFAKSSIVDIWQGSKYASAQVPWKIAALEKFWNS